MEQLIFLFTPQHTGTHFARMLLESHRHIDFCIFEDARIPVDLRRDYICRGEGVEPGSDPRERLLEYYVRDYYRGAITAAEFFRCLDCYAANRIEAAPAFTRGQLLARHRRQEFRQDLGIELEPKQPLYRLFHGHCGPDYAGYSFCGKEFRLVVTVRHPLLSILSILRRDPKVLDDFLFALEFVFQLDAFFSRTDLWQNDEPRLLGVFSHLGLTPGAPTLQYVGQRPVINRTLSAGEPHPVHNFRYQRAMAPGLARTLDDAKRLLTEENRVHDLLRPCWDELVRRGLFEHYERLGYKSPRLG